jgi:hypothetical protein
MSETGRRSASWRAARDETSTDWSKFSTPMSYLAQPDREKYGGAAAVAGHGAAYSQLGLVVKPALINGVGGIGRDARLSALLGAASQERQTAGP